MIIFEEDWLLIFALLLGCASLFGCKDYSKEAMDSSIDPLSISNKADIQPVISSTCYSCHSAKTTDHSKLRYSYLDNFEELKEYALTPSFVNFVNAATIPNQIY